MNRENYLLLSAISYFEYSNGYCYFKLADLAKCIGLKDNSLLSKKLKRLTEESLIENCTRNGCCLKYKILDKSHDYHMYDIFLKFNNPTRTFLSYILYVYEDYDKITIKSMSDKSGLNKRDIYTKSYYLGGIKNIKKMLSEKKIIKLTDEEILKDMTMTEDKQMIFCSYSRKRCSLCGEFFMSNNKNSLYCRICEPKVKAEYDKEYLDIAITLNNRTRISALHRGLDKLINVHDIYKKIIEQRGKCYYTGLDLKDYSIGEKDCPSIDRIDSSKGYTIDNIIICKGWANIMKMETDLDIFKERISIIYNHMN